MNFDEDENMVEAIYDLQNKIDSVPENLINYDNQNDANKIKL